MEEVVFFGSSEHCLVTLEALKNSGYRIAAVVTQPPKPVGRKQIVTPTPVELWALENGVEVIKPESWKYERSQAERERLVSLGCGVAILSVYGKILPQSVIEIFPMGILNIHPSLLPKYRGPAPAVGVILAGEKISGTTIILLSAEMDAGPVLGQVSFDVEEFEVPESYYKKGFAVGTQKLLEVLPAYMAGELKPIDQNHAQATYTKMLTKEDGKIDWSEQVEMIGRKIRAYTPWPGAWTEVYMRNSTVCLTQEMSAKIRVLKQNLDEKNNETDAKLLRLKILSAEVDQGLLVLKRVQLEGDAVRAFDDLRVQG